MKMEYHNKYKYQKETGRVKKKKKKQRNSTTNLDKFSCRLPTFGNKRQLVIERWKDQLKNRAT